MNKNTMKNRTLLTVVLLAILLIVASAIYIVYISSDPFNDLVTRYPNGAFNDTGSYKIDTETILATLAQGETDVFTLELATPQAPLEKVIMWHQSDYLEIASALHQFVWSEKLDNWNLYSMSFDASCQDGSNGFLNGDFTYFKTVFHGGKLTYTAHEILISPQYENVSWGGGMDFPRPVLGWKSIVLNRLKVTSENALKIAEENGGSTARLAAENKCTISLILSGYTGWNVVYEGSDGLFIFEIKIDPYTGRVSK